MLVLMLQLQPLQGLHAAQAHQQGYTRPLWARWHHSQTRKLALTLMLAAYGRYDDRNHWMFRTLHNEHNLDYHQACIKGAVIEKGGEQPLQCEGHPVIHSPASLWMICMEVWAAC